ncbi:hypothetical protein L218DRAFT_947697 [Marasmius fiardii PR-910]|nr:hypothetical protein L218DRAFT_947697 [Marasmius fiardii PR-910]
MNDGFDNTASRTDGTQHPFPVISSNGVGEGTPLNFGFPPGINQGSPFNPAQYNQFAHPNYIFPGWMMQHSGMQMTPARPIIGTNNMDLDGTDHSDDGEWISHPEHRIIDHVHRQNRKCGDLLGHIIMAKRRGDPGLKSALKDIEDDIIQPYKESAQRAKAKVSSLESKLDSTKSEYEARLTNMDNNFNAKYQALQQKYQDALDDKARLVVENTSLKEAMDRTRREYSPTSFRGRGRDLEQDLVGEDVTGTSLNVPSFYYTFHVDSNSHGL